MADKSVPQNTGGQYNLPTVTSNTTGTVVTSAGGRLCQVAVITAGTSATSFYDASAVTAAASANLIWTDVTNRAVGSVVSLQIPVANGIVVSGAAGSAGYCVCYNSCGPFGD